MYLFTSNICEYVEYVRYLSSRFFFLADGRYEWSVASFVTWNLDYSSTTVKDAEAINKAHLAHLSKEKNQDCDQLNWTLPDTQFSRGFTIFWIVVNR